MTYRYRQVIEEGGGLTYLRHEFDLSPSELFVLDNLIKHDHPRHGCFPKQKTIAHETGLPLRTVKAALKRLADKGLIEREKLPYTDTRGRMRPGKIHHYRFADDVSYACSLAWERFKSEREEVLTEAMTEEIETELVRCRNGTNRADESVPVAPDRCRNGINRESKVIPAVPDRCKNGIHIGAKAAPVGRCKNGTRIGAETALEKLEVEVASKNWKRNSRSAAADAAVETLSTDSVGSGNGETASRGGRLYEQDETAGREARAATHRGEPVPERKRCACGGEIPPEKAESRDECRDCYTTRVRREEKERRAEEDGQRRLGFLEGRDRGRPQRGLFS